MKINFVLNAMSLTGGVKAEFMLAQQLKKFGHEVNVIYPRLPVRMFEKYKLMKPVQLVKEAGFLMLDRWKPVDWYDSINVMKVMTLDKRNIPDADICIAHSWETAYCVNEYPRSKGIKFYHVQDYEDWLYDNVDIVKSYQLGQYNIVTSQFIKRRVEKYATVDLAIPHAPDHETFYPVGDHTADMGPFGVLMCYRKDAYRGLAYAVEAYEKIMNSQTRLIMFGPLDYGSCEFECDEYYQKPSDDKLRMIYNSANVFVFPSKKEGWGMPPMEAMCCSTPVIATGIGAIPEYIDNRIDGLVVKPGSSQDIFYALRDLYENPVWAQKIGYAGFNAMKKYRWENSAKMLEKRLLEHLRNGE